MDLTGLARSLENYAAGLESSIIWDRTDVGDGHLTLRNFYLPTGDGGVLGFEAAYLRELRRNGDRYVIGQARLPFRSIRMGNGEFSMEALALSGLRVPVSPPQSTPTGIPLDFDMVALGNFVLSVDSRQALSISDSHLTAEIAPEGDKVRYRGAIEAIRVYSDAIQNTQAKGFLAALGYVDPAAFLEVDATLRGGRIAPAEIAIDQLDLTVIEAAAVRVSAELTAPPFGGTSATDRHRADIRLKAEETALRSLRLRLENETLLPALLRWLGGGDGSVGIGKMRILGAFGAIAAPFLTPEEAAGAATALSDFLDDPQVLEIEVVAEPPVTLATLFRTGGLPELQKEISVRIMANPD